MVEVVGVKKSAVERVGSQQSKSWQSAVKESAVYSRQSKSRQSAVKKVGSRQSKSRQSDRMQNAD